MWSHAIGRLSTLLATCQTACLAFATLCVSAFAQGSLEPIVVTRPAAADAGAVRIGEELRYEIGALWDVTRAFASLPSAASVSDRTASLSVRGGDPTENAVRVDGVDIPSIGHMAWQGETGGIVTILSPSAVREAEFHVGAFPTRYGGRMSSVLDVRLREGRRGGLQASGEASPVGAAASLEGGFRRARGSWIASYRAGLLDSVRRPAALTATPSYRDGHAKLSYDVSSNAHVSAFALLGSSNVAVGRGAAAPTDEFASTKRAVGATWTQRHGGGARTRVTLYDVRATYDAQAWEPPILEAAYTDDSMETHSGVEAAVDLGSPAVAATLGVHWRRVSVAHDIASRPWRGFSENVGQDVWLGRQRVDVERVGHRLAAYADASHSPARWLRLSLGLRVMRLTLTDSGGLTPRVAAVARLSDGAELRLAAGVTRQSPSYFELALDEANASLPDSTATHIATRLTHRAAGGVVVSAEVYAKEYRHLRVLLDADSKRPSGELRASAERETRGLELEARLRRTRGHVAVVAALSRAVARSAPGEASYPSDFDYRRLVTLSGSRQVGRAWTLGAKWQFIGGRPYTAYEVRDTLVGGFEAVPGVSARNGERYPSYRRLDAQLVRRVRWADHEVGLFVEARNALNRANVLSRRFDASTGAFAPVHQFPRLILVGVTANLPRM